ncbi:MAG TPA: protease complex subunit PrcB family protein [Rubrobacteraceae bacterium]|nr:protease complex subunit PrcB family protein [Rubrobacteraceae bacterium]
MVHVAATLLVLMIAVGCAAGDGSGASDRTADPETSDEAREETAAQARALRVEGISSDAPGQGPEHPQVILAPSAGALSRETGARVPDSGEGIYLAVYWGRKPTGGYSLAVRSARLQGERVTIELALEKPAPDAMVTQALTYPYAVAVVRDLGLEGNRFSFVTGEGRKLDWPVRRAEG